jgi:hypothetical protein
MVLHQKPLLRYGTLTAKTPDKTPFFTPILSPLEAGKIIVFWS